ncbi:dephospho-CoA kinase [Miniimonas arenae]|uniref:dephospho-CoA kinase n=1 Tax=Miniimonas arenae TaxID=676201 RepID=UPI0028A743A8|nr:dephospho-CoA kinase [Miniimonas arenae]
MLIVGLTGGIASGKSTAARTLAELGADVVDADVLAREVLDPGTPGLAAVVARFGSGVLAGDGSLDRAALAARVFDDVAARRDLEAIVHPAVGAAFEERVRRAREDAVVVHDVPLLTENGLAPRYHLVLVTWAPLEERVRRAVEERGMTREAVLARVAAQASDEERAAVADVVLDTSEPVAAMRARIERLWRDRLVPYEANVRHRRAVEHAGAVVEPDGDRWSAAAARLVARVRRAGGELVHDVAHVGRTAVPGAAAPDVIELQVGVASWRDVGALTQQLERAGFPRVGEFRLHHTPAALPGFEEAAQDWLTVTHGAADPGRAVEIAVRLTGSAGWLWPLAARDRLRAAPAESSPATTSASFAEVAPVLADWVRRTHWRPEGRRPPVRAVLTEVSGAWPRG